MPARGRQAYLTALAVRVGKTRTGKFGSGIGGFAGDTMTGSRGGLTDQALSSGSKAYGRSSPTTGIGGGGGAAGIGGAGGSSSPGGGVIETTTGAGGTPVGTGGSPHPSPVPSGGGSLDLGGGSFGSTGNNIGIPSGETGTLLAAPSVKQPIPQAVSTRSLGSVAPIAKTGVSGRVAGRPAPTTTTRARNYNTTGGNNDAQRPKRAPAPTVKKKTPTGTKSKAGRPVPTQPRGTSTGNTGPKNVAHKPGTTRAAPVATAPRRMTR